MSSNVVKVRPDNWAASDRFGVTSSACPMRRRSASRVVSTTSLSPLVAMSTGSTTSCFSLYCSTAATITSMAAVVGIMPVFSGWGPRSSSTMVSWRRMKSGSTVKMPSTPVVFWAVSAVITALP